MRRGVTWLCLLLLWLTPGALRAQEEVDDFYADTGQVTAPRLSYTGLSWGFTRTWWSRSPHDEGYAEAGTAGPSIGLRLWQPMGSRSVIVPYLQYFWMNATETTLRDGSPGGVITERMAFRELDLGLNYLYSLSSSRTGFYLGGGPMIRWGQSARREVGANRSGLRQKATWFGVALLAGYRVPFGDKSVAFFEPQFVVSPDLADRWQDTYPPENLNVMMGILW